VTVVTPHERDAQARALAEVCRRLHGRGLLAGAEGNVSVRLADGSLLVTASGIDKASATADDIVRLHADGTDHHDGPRRGGDGDGGADTGRRRASSEVGMHLAIYAARRDVGAIVHAHPPVATGFALAGEGMPHDLLPELPVVVGPVALVPYGRPGTPALASAMTPFLPAHEVFLLANHGVTTVGRSLTDALLRMESVEQAARIITVARLLGGARPLPPGEGDALAALRHVGELPTHRVP